MLAVIQRVSKANVTVNNVVIGAIDEGLLVLLGVEKNDMEKEADYLIQKISNLRIFNDSDGKMNNSLRDVKGQMLIISQFTLAGDCRKGRRPSFAHAASPDEGERLYEYFVEVCRRTGIPVETGKFGAMMDVSLVNDGPVTFVIDSRKTTGTRVPIPD